MIDNRLQITEEQLFKKIQEALQKREPQDVLRYSLHLAECFPSHSNILIASRNIQSIVRELEASFHEKTRVKVALLYSSTADWVKDYLLVSLFAERLFPQIYLAPYNQVEQEILNPKSGFYHFAPEIVFFHMELSSVLPDVSRYEENDVEEAVRKIRGLTDQIRGRTRSVVVIDNFPQPPHLTARSGEDLKVNSLKEWFHRLNRRLGEEFLDDDAVMISDFDQLTGIHGKEISVNLKLLYLAHIEFSESFLPIVCKKYAGYVKALKGKGRKCVVLDLDHTLWGGVVGEDGFEGIRLSQTGEGRAFFEFQKLLKELMERGVLLAVNSKNNPQDALKVIREHPSMLLREKHFCCVKINWDDKASNMIQISRQLNIGLDSMVFLDDDPRERALVRKALPGVLVPEMPPDPSQYGSLLMGLNDFEMLSFSEEDAKRTQLYQEQRERDESKGNFQSLEEFLYDLEISVRISPAAEKDLPRICQLMQRTNQFNMTARRYTSAELGPMVSAEAFRLFTLHVADRFGESGLVGAAVLERERDSFWVRAFLLSCRVLGRGIENFFMNHLCRTAKDEGAVRLIGELIFTEKNQPARDFYQKYGFTPARQNETSSEWIYPVQEKIPVPVAWINAERYAKR